MNVEAQNESKLHYFVSSVQHGLKGRIPVKQAGNINYPYRKYITPAKEEYYTFSCCISIS